MASALRVKEVSAVAPPEWRVSQKRVSRLQALYLYLLDNLDRATNEVRVLQGVLHESVTLVAALLSSTRRLSTIQIVCSAIAHLNR